MAITVGIAAGLINAGVVFLQLTFPLLIVFLLVAVLPLENNAITWSVVGRQLQGSFWPLLLGADSTQSSKVKTRVLVFSTASTVGLLLLATAAVVTPLGLYQSVTEGVPRNVSFVYVKDLSPIGLATTSRDEYHASRLCSGGGAFMANCPGQEHGFTFFTNETGQYIHDDDDTAYMSSVPPTNLSIIFGSGRTGNMSTVASAYDVQYRSYIQIANVDQNSSLGLNTGSRFRMDQYRKRSVARFSMFQSFILGDDYMIMDGVILDMKRGGIGFRNHTVPAHVGQGAEWTESLLWLEPETACVDTNLTFKWAITDYKASQNKPSVVDNGGFVNLSRDYPYIDLNDTQTRPEIHARAHKGAILWNWDLMRYFNASRNTSYDGKVYQLPISPTLGSQVIMDRFSILNSSLTIGGNIISLSPSVNSSGYYIAPQTPVRGFGGGDKANITHITADGGILMGAPTSDGGSGEFRNEPGTRWKAPLYSCASTVKAYVMDVTFTINQTASLSNLVVKKLEPRKYASNATTPVWAVENTGFNISGISPMWGMVADEYENAPHLQTVRQEHFYLPAGASQYWAVVGLGLNQDYAWTAEAPQSVLSATYGCAIGYTDCLGLQEYSGKTNYPLYLKWKSLTSDASTSGKVIDLLWTDIMANYLTSGRSRLTTPGTDSTNEGVRADAHSASGQVVLATTLVKYHIYFAIPGLIFLVFYLLVLVVFLFLLCARRTTFDTLRSLTNQTAVGRAMTIERYGNRHNVRAMTTKAWIDLHGDADVLITKEAKWPESGKADDEKSNNEVELTAPLVPKNDDMRAAAYDSR